MSKKKIKKGDRKKEIIILSLILFFAFLIRVIYLGVPPLWIDEAMSANMALHIAQTGLPLFGSGFMLDRDFGFHYIQAFFLLFSHSDFAARFISVIFGLLTILLAYKFGEEYSKSAGLFTSLLFAFFFLEVLYSRQARFYQMFQFFFFLTIYLLYKSEKNKKYFFWAILSFLITVDTHFMGITLIPLFIYFVLFKKRQYWPVLFLLVFPLIIGFHWFNPIFGRAYSNFLSFRDFRFFPILENSIIIIILTALFGIFSFFSKNKKITLFILVPSFLLFFGLIFASLTSLRYIYFFLFPILLYSGLFFYYLYNKYGTKSLLFLLILIFLTSNICIKENPSFLLKPISEGLPSYIERYTNYKSLPEDLRERILNNTIIALFSQDVEWNLKKPDLVLPPIQSIRGLFAVKNCSGQACDMYSGSPVLLHVYNNKFISAAIPERPYYFLADNFSLNILYSNKINKQIDFFDRAIDNCSLEYSAEDLKIYGCF